MVYKDIENRIASFNRELETEDRLVGVGLKDHLESNQLYKKYKDVFNKRVLVFVKRLQAIEQDRNQKEVYDRVYYFVAYGILAQKLAARQDKLTTYYSNAKVKFDGQSLTYYNLAPRISKEPNFERRELLDDLASGVVIKAKSAELSLLQDETDLIYTMG